MIETNKKPESQPHPCSKGNFDIARSLLKTYDFVKWEYQICDYDVMTGMIKNPRYIGFYGKHNEDRYGFNVSLHQNTTEFEKEFGETLKFLSENGYIFRKDRPRELDLNPTEKHRKQSIYFSSRYSQRVNPFKCIIAHADHVEVINEMNVYKYRYDMPDSEWKDKTGWP